MLGRDELHDGERRRRRRLVRRKGRIKTKIMRMVVKGIDMQEYWKRGRRKRKGLLRIEYSIVVRQVGRRYRVLST